jgi:hypothetical protein
VPRDNHGTMYALLLAINSFGDQNIEYASASLEAMNSEIYAVTVGTDEGYELTNSEVGQTLNALNRMEELISRIQESQLLLERAARYLRLELEREDVDFREQLAVLISDIGAVKEHAGFEHDKVRYLQQSVMTSLNAKQNQVAKVFTIIAGGVPAADADRQHLRHELRTYARTRLEMGLPGHHHADADRGAAALVVHQAEGLAALTGARNIDIRRRLAHMSSTRSS